ncbi:LCCL domain-containing protein [Devosia sp.]|uniref:LCCL domain-containing protein n=1 Tax=Devosia sp. TaxID=1871048 RepID=UPI0026181948|nr:LCCL domain-containing protein [Devosia sp.]
MATKVQHTIVTGAFIALLCVSSASAESNQPSTAKLGTPQVAITGAVIEADPGSLFNYAGEVGQTLKFNVVGSDAGAIWGDGTYTSDSALAVAAVHAGALKVGQAGVVTVEIVPGLDSYAGVARNGVVSISYGPWQVSYRIVGAEATSAAQVQRAPENLTVYRGQNGTLLEFEVTGSTTESVWGDDIYTDDSSIAAAAVHAGALQPGQTGIVVIEVMPGQASYSGSQANGVASRNYGPWDGSFKFVLNVDAKVQSKLSN